MSDRTQPRHRIDPREPRDPYAAEGVEPPPASVAEALLRAQLHGRAAAAEGFAAVRALIDAAALVSGGRSSDASRVLGPIAKLFESLTSELGGGVIEGPSRMLESVLRAIDDEIAVWEERARTDTEARTVLRAFLGLREVLWEFGMRQPGPAASRAPRPPSPPNETTRPRSQRAAHAHPPSRPRVQRVPVQG